MNKFISLTKIQVKDLFTKYQNGMNLKSNLIGKLLMVAVVVLLLTPSINFSLLTFQAFAMMNAPELVITSMYVGAVILMFMLAIPFIVSVFFYSKDMKFLAALPIREDAIIFSKLSTVYLYLLIISTLLIGPAVVIYGINVGFDLTLVFFGLLALILAPVLPLLISALLVLMLTKVVSNSNKRNLLVIAGNVLLIVAIVGIQLGLTRYMANPETLQKIFSNQEGLLGFVGLRFPPSVWMTRMILGSFKDALYFIGLNLVVLLILQKLATFFYRRAMMAFNQGGQIVRGKIYYIHRSIGWQLVKRHIMIILTQPTFLLNTVMSLIVPIMMFVILSFSGEASLEMLKSPEIMPYMIFIFAGILVSPAIIANISSTAITREGKTFWETKALPISSQDNIRYRVITTMIFNFAGSIILLVTCLFILPLSWETVLLGGLFTIAVTLFLATVDIIVNIYRPLLNWTNPTAAVKNNMNIMISLGIRGFFALLFYLLFKYLPITWSSDTTILLGSGFFFVLYLVTRYILYSYYAEKFAQITV